MTYHNTTDQKAQKLASYQQQAKNQDDVVLETFRQSDNALTPSEVLKRSFNDNTPLTSIRRSISNLTKRGLLTRTTYTKNSPYGRPEHLWCLS